MSTKSRSFYATRGDYALHGLNNELARIPLTLDAFVDFQASRRNDGVQLSLFYIPDRPLFMQVAAPEDGAWFLKNGFVDHVDVVFSAAVDPGSVSDGSFTWRWDGDEEAVLAADIDYSEDFKQLTISAPTLPLDYVGSLALTFADVDSATTDPLAEAVSLHFDITETGSAKAQPGAVSFSRATLTGYLGVGRLVVPFGQNVDQMVATYLQQKSLDKDRVLKVVQLEGSNRTLEIFLLWWRSTSPKLLSVSPRASGTLAEESPPTAILLQFDQPVSSPSAYLEFDGLVGTDASFTIDQLDGLGRQWRITKDTGLFAVEGQHTLKISGLPNIEGDLPGPPMLFSWQVLPLMSGGGVSDHGALTGLGDDDHPQYQLRTEKNAANGYAGLDGSTLLSRAQLPAGPDRVYRNAGSPEGVVTAAVGSLCLDTTNGDIYEKKTGAGNTGWLQMATLLDVAAGVTAAEAYTDAQVAAAVTAAEAYADAADAAHVGAGDPHTQYILASGTRAFTGDQSMGSHYLTNLLSPVSGNDAATKAYVDALIQGLDPKPSVFVATTPAGGNITLSGEQTIDGFLTSASRVLVKDQTLPEENGIYVSAAGAWTRATDADTWTELISAYVFVEQGTLNGDNGWLCTIDVGGTLGTDPVTWAQFSGAGQIIAGAALSKTGNQLDVNVDNSTIEVSSDALQVKAGGITEAHLGLSNNTTNDVSSTQHGFAPIAPADANKWLNGLTGGWTIVGGRFVKMTIFIVSGANTWTPDAETQSYDVFAKGGGGGAGSTATVPGGNAAAAGGGASGSHCFKRYTSAPSGAVSFNVGAVGPGGTGGGGGAAGGTTTFPDVAASLSAPGGGGGGGAAATTFPAIIPGGIPGGVATGGDINTNGEAGGDGLLIAIAAAAMMGGAGGAGPYGSKMPGGQNAAPATAASGFGSGGPAPSSLGAVGTLPGSPGTVGIVIVWEYT